MPQTTKPLEIAIIGVGYTGMMTAVHLIKKATSPLTLYLINDRYSFGKGPAYSTSSDKHILNVPAAKMTAFPDQPSHFLDWAHRQDEYSDIDKDILGRVFMPRKVFGVYLSEIWEETVANKRADTIIHIINEKATDIENTLNKNSIKLASGHSISSDYVVLATGNESPKNIPVSDTSLYDDPHYIREPWGDSATQNMDVNKDILILGNGLTAVDTIISIMDHGYHGVIHTISPGGLAILPHKYGYISYSKFTEEIKAPYKLNEIYALAIKHIKILKRAGLSPEPVIDSLRALTPAIWQGLSVEDKRRFLKYHMSRWNQIRHRLPGHMYDYLIKLQQAGKLIVHSGRVVDISRNAGTFNAEIQEYNKKQLSVLAVSRIINCMGPHTDVSESPNPLLRNLISKGIMQADELKIGIKTTDKWTLIDRAGKEIPTIYTIGGNLRGLLWETTATPELRVQAEKLAKELLSKG